jgi:hypothetical protein
MVLVQADPREFRQLDLRVHSFLAGVPLHDVWVAELAGGGPDRTVEDARLCFTPQTATTANAAVRLLFAIRSGVGRIFGWDRDSERWDGESFRNRLTEEDRARSLVPPGTDDSIFKVVYVFPYESLSEVRNATVHAFSCLALRRTMTGYRLYWAIYVKPIGRWTALYMRAIDPFRRAVVYPAVINRIRVEWSTRFGAE